MTLCNFQSPIIVPRVTNDEIFSLSNSFCTQLIISIGVGHHALKRQGWGDRVWLIHQVCLDGSVRACFRTPRVRGANTRQLHWRGEQKGDEDSLYTRRQLAMFGRLPAVEDFQDFLAAQIDYAGTSGGKGNAAQVAPVIRE